MPTDVPPEKRGLGHDHRRQRARLINLLKAKTRAGATIRCWWCGEPLHAEPALNPDGKPLEADHSKPRSRYGTDHNPADRLLHHRCNRERGDGSRDHLRPAVAGQDARPAAADGVLGHRAMPWPK